MVVMFNFLRLVLVMMLSLFFMMMHR